MKNALRTAICLVFLSGLALPAFAQSKSSDDDRAKEVIQHLEKMGEIATKNADNCDAMGEELMAYTSKHGNDLKAAVIALDGLSADEQKALEEKYKARAEKAMEGFMKTANCASNTKVMEAMQVLEAQEQPNGGDGHDHGGGHGHDHGHGDGKHTHAEPTKEQLKVAETLVEQIEGVSGIIDEHTGDCEAMGKALDSFADKNGAEMKKLVAATEKFPKDIDQALQDKFKPRLEKAIGSFMNIGECAQNKKVEAAMKKLAF